MIHLDADPGPVSDERPDRPTSRFPRNRVIQLEEQMQASWRKLVMEARDCRDLNVLNAVSAFRRDLEAFLAP